ncbi:hypothetical protein D3C71_1604780 [compost metagenome]
MTTAVHYAHDGTYLLAFGSVSGAVFPEGSLVEEGYPPGWPLTSCPSHRHRWNIHTLQWDETPVPAEDAWAKVRAMRDELLAATDWRVMVAAEAGGALPQAWRDYRQALRDITKQEDPAQIEWPVAPG